MQNIQLTFYTILPHRVNQPHLYSFKTQTIAFIEIVLSYKLINIVH